MCLCFHFYVNIVFVCESRVHSRRKIKAGEAGAHGENLFWAVPALQWVCVSVFDIRYAASLHCFNPCLCAGQSLNSVKVKAGEALRLHRTSVGEEAQEDSAVEREDREGSEESSPSVTAESPTSNRGVFSTITHAVQNTVSTQTWCQSTQNHW